MYKTIHLATVTYSESQYFSRLSPFRDMILQRFNEKKLNFTIVNFNLKNIVLLPYLGWSINL
jgi:hypothetical protein